MEPQATSNLDWSAISGGNLASAELRFTLSIPQNSRVFVWVPHRFARRSVVG